MLSTIAIILNSSCLILECASSSVVVFISLTFAILQRVNISLELVRTVQSFYPSFQSHTQENTAHHMHINHLVS